MPHPESDFSDFKQEGGIVAEARRLIEKGNVQQAAGFLKEAVRRSPENVEGFISIARLRS